MINPELPSRDVIMSTSHLMFGQQSEKLSQDLSRTADVEKSKTVIMLMMILKI